MQIQNADRESPSGKETVERACAVYWCMQSGSMHMYYGLRCETFQPIGIWLPDYHPSPGGCGTSDPETWCTDLQVERGWKPSPRTGHRYAAAFTDQADPNYPPDNWPVPDTTGIVVTDDVKRRCRVDTGPPRAFRLIAMEISPQFQPALTIRFGIELESATGPFPTASHTDTFGAHACCIRWDDRDFDVITRYPL